MSKLLFQNPEFHTGLNVSVRRGTKWNIENQKGVTLADLQGNEYGSVNIETRVLRFCDLTNSDLACEHDPVCRTVAGLLSVMEQIYPTFDEREMVTLVYFRNE